MPEEATGQICLGVVKQDYEVCEYLPGSESTMLRTVCTRSSPSLLGVQQHVAIAKYVS